MLDSEGNLKLDELGSEASSSGHRTPQEEEEEGAENGAPPGPPDAIDAFPPPPAAEGRVPLPAKGPPREENGNGAPIFYRTAGSGCSVPGLGAAQPPLPPTVLSADRLPEDSRLSHPEVRHPELRQLYGSDRLQQV